MKILNNTQYYKAIKPLQQVTINNLFAFAVVENKVTGVVYVDDEDCPKIFYIAHPYGMSLLFGDTSNNAFIASFVDYALNTYKTRRGYEWLQVFPDEWNNKMKDLFDGRLIEQAANIGNNSVGTIEVNTRINFTFNYEKYIGFKSKYIVEDYTIMRTDEKLFEEMHGSVVPKKFWDSAKQFYRLGVGYSLFYQSTLVSTAFSSFINEEQLEIGIETIDGYKGKGFAFYTCAALIDYCIANGLEPVWACRLQNTGSYKLALKLGFEPTLRLPYYRLCN